MDALVLHLLSQYGYFALYFLMLIGGTYIPIPTGILLIAVGALSHHHHFFNLTLSFLVALAASITNNIIAYTITRRIGTTDAYTEFVRKNRFAGYIEKEFKRRPRVVIFVSRFVGFTILPVNSLAGLTGIPLFQFISVAAIADGLCIAAYLAAGYGIGLAWAHDIHTALHVIEYLFGAVAILYLLFFFISKIMKSTSKSTSASK